jgi:hypothetical protein
MSKIMKWMRHLGSTSSAFPSNTTPGTIAGLSEAPLRAIHESRWSPSTVKKNPSGDFTKQRILVVVFNATGCTDGPGLVRVSPLRANIQASPTDCSQLLERETKWCESDMLLGREENAARFSCDGCVYAMEVVSAGHLKSFPTLYTSVGSQWHHVNLVFTYDAASRQSWDETAANNDDIRGRCENGSVPFTTLLLAMGLPDAPIPEAAAFARERGCLAAEYSPIDGRGVCTALASLVEHAHAAGTKSTLDSRPFVDSSHLLHVLFNSVPGDQRPPVSA